MAGPGEIPDRIALIAGGGALPMAVAKAARGMGEDPFIVALSGESTEDWSGFPHAWIGLGNMAGFRDLLKKHAIRRVVLSGAVGRRPLFREIRPTGSTIRKLPQVLRKLVSGGDNAVLTMVIDLIEAEGARVIGVQDVVPALLARTGHLGRYRPRQVDMDDIKVAAEAARRLGEMDIGQGAVAVGGRVVALEGPEGTDQMLSRVAEMRQAGRISKSRPGVLVKLCKPGQDRRADLPSIGPSTLMNAQLAGLAGIAVQAGHSLVLDEPTLIALANREKMFVYGLDPDGSISGEAGQ